MTSRAFTRLTTPLIVVSVLLLGVAIGAAFYVHSLQRSTSEIVTNHMASVRAAYELQIRTRQVRTQLERYISTHEPGDLPPVTQLRQPAEESLRECERLATTPEEQDLMRLARAAHDEFFKKYKTATEKPWDGQTTAHIKALIDPVATAEVLKWAEAYQKLNDGMLRSANEANQRLADRLVIGLLGIGVCGAAGGLLVGWVIAASVRRSIDQTRTRLRRAADQLNRIAGAAPPEGDEVAAEGGELDAALKNVSASVAAVIDRLDRSQRDALRAEQLAYVGQMAAGIAHEVRNPLMAIKLLVQKAAERRHGQPFRGRDLQVLEEEIDRVEQIITNFLDFARPPQPERHLVEGRPLIERAAGSLAARAEQQGVRLQCVLPAEPLSLDVDAGQVQQVLFNLILNALDAQGAGGTVRVELALERRHPEAPPAAVIRVEDEGPGLPPELGERIFDPFISSKPSGMGLGLSICRRIVEAHGGTIRGADRPGGGAVFTVRLPAAVKPAPARQGA